VHGGRSAVRFPVGAREFSFLRKFQTNFGAHAVWYLMCTGVFPGLKRLEREVNYSPPSSEDFKNWWSYTSTVPIRLCGACSENFTFLYLFSSFVFFLLCFRLSFFVYLAPFLVLSYNSSLCLPFYFFYLSIFLSLSCFFLLFHSLSYLLVFPFCLLFVAFYEWFFHLTTSQSVIILNGKKHPQNNLLPCLLIMSPGSSLEVYRRFRDT
jgi:hypothetical protein